VEVENKRWTVENILGEVENKEVQSGQHEPDGIPSICPTP
jgi:hypothetical protein